MRRNTTITRSIGQRQWLRLAAVAGMIGPLLLGGVIAGLTVAQYDFLRRLRWHPIHAPTTDWPSGLALGPYGPAMTGTFIVSGLLLIVFAAGLERGLRAGSRLGPWLLAGAGGAMLLLAFRVDPSYRDTPRSWHGTIHDAAYVLLGVSLLPAMLLLARRFQLDPRWQGYAPYTQATLALIVPAFALKGMTFYLFLGGALLWIELVALRLWRIAQP